MDLMNSDFSRKDLTDWLTVAWKCGQSTNSASSSSFWVDGSVQEVHVPEALKEKTRAQSSFLGFMRSVGILTARNVCLFGSFTELTAPNNDVFQLVNYTRNILGVSYLFVHAPLFTPNLSMCRILDSFGYLQ
jgi:hypothetical protein